MPTGTDMAALTEACRAAADPDRLARLAGGLGLSVEGLRRLGIGWCGASRAWSFPMVDAASRVLGLRLRTEAGLKFAVKGSRDGLFLPSGLVGSGSLLICEGPTDTVALLDLGFEAVGRPSCSGGTKLLIELVKRHRPEDLVIIADRDSHRRGLTEAVALIQHLIIHVGRLRLVLPPDGIKDARAWKRAGASHETILGEIEASPVRRISVRAQVQATLRGRCYVIP